MTYSGKDYDVIVIGKGHAGKEAAKKAARMGKTALLLKLNPGSIASVMCSSSQQESPGEIPSGIQAQLVSLEDENNWSQKLKFEPLDSDSHHSVYILQVPEIDPEKNLLFGESLPSEEEPTPAEIEAEHIPTEPRSTRQSLGSFAKTEEIAESAPPSDHSRDRESISPDPEPEPPEDTVFHQREIYNRKRLLHRQSPSVGRGHPTVEPSGQKGKSREPVFREREKDLRKKLVQDRRSSVEQTPPRRESLSSPHIHGKPTREPSVTEERSLPDAKESHTEPFAHTQKSGQRPAKRTSSSVIPMDQGRIKHRKANRPKEPFHLIDKEKRTPPPATNSEPPSPDSSLVWEERNPKREQALTYEPFQEMKEKGPLSRHHMNPTREKSGPRQEGPSVSPTPGPLQSPSRKPPSNPKREEPGMVPKQQRVASPPPLRREEPNKEQKTASHFHLNQEAARNVLKNSNEGLKKDELDISDPFGESYDELFTPFSGSDPQDVQLEKRKLALRGLHNLINNLG